jgi:type IX secretion system PorP/SprF family membrane protein
MGILKGRLNGGILGLGLQLFNDQAGDNKMGMTEANLSIAYHLPLNRNNFLTAGIQSGITQKRLSQANMQWDSQYDPNAPNGYNSSLSSGETIGFNSYVFWNISAGMLWSYNSKPATLSSNDAIKATVGAAVFHINQPRHSFYEVSDNKLYMKIVLHGNAFFGIKNTPFSLVPSVVWYHQGPSNEIVAGTLFRYRLKSASRYTGFEKESALALGAYYRVGDAIVAAAQFEWRNFMLTFSYDINISGLTVASRSNGGLEVGIRYITPLFDPKNKSLY